MSTKVSLSSCRVDSKREADGDWVESITLPGVEFKVRSITFPPYTIARDLLQQKLRRRSGGKPIADQDWIVGHGRLYAEHLLLDWRGFDEPYTRELAADTLTNFEFRQVIQAIELAASQLAQADIEFIEETEKNSETPSATS